MTEVSCDVSWPKKPSVSGNLLYQVESFRNDHISGIWRLVKRSWWVAVPPPPGTEIEGTVVGYGYKAQLFLKKYHPHPLQAKSLLSSSRIIHLFLVKTQQLSHLQKAPLLRIPRNPTKLPSLHRSPGEICLSLCQGAMAELNTLLRVEVAPGKSSGWVDAECAVNTYDNVNMIYDVHKWNADINRECKVTQRRYHGR